VRLGARTLDVDDGPIELVIDVLAHRAEDLSRLGRLQTPLDEPGGVS